MKTEKTLDVVVIGGGQSALACAYFLRRKKLNYLLLDSQEKPGGAWNEVWDSLTLFSPAQHSSLPGWMMPKTEKEYPSKNEVIEYLKNYEIRYDFPVQRNTYVNSVSKEGRLFSIKTSQGSYKAKTVISATGTWESPYIPNIPGKENFKGDQLHVKEYKTPEDFSGKKVLVVGEGNSGAQILSEISKVTTSFWATSKPPKFLPDDVDGKELFDIATAKYHAQQKGEPFDATKYHLGNIVMVPTVKKAQNRGVLQSSGTIKLLTGNSVVWQHGNTQPIDVIIWCTGFHFSTQHLSSLVDSDEKGRIKTQGTKAKEIDGLWLVGYGGWTGFASATLIGVGRSAKQTVKEITHYIQKL